MPNKTPFNLELTPVLIKWCYFLLSTEMGMALCLSFGHGGLILWNAAQDTLQILERVQILWMIRVAYIQALAGGSLDVSLTGQ